jgi:hypothetical protein
MRSRLKWLAGTSALLLLSLQLACSEKRSEGSEPRAAVPADAPVLRPSGVQVGTVIAQGKVLDAKEFGLDISVSIEEDSHRKVNAKVVIRNQDPLDVMVLARWETPAIWIIVEGDDGRWTCFADPSDPFCGSGFQFVRFKPESSRQAEIGFSDPHRRIRIGIEIDPRAFAYVDPTWSDHDPNDPDHDILVTTARRPRSTSQSSYGFVWSAPITVGN